MPSICCGTRRSGTCCVCLCYPFADRFGYQTICSDSPVDGCVAAAETGRWPGSFRRVGQRTGLGFLLRPTPFYLCYRPAAGPAHVCDVFLYRSSRRCVDGTCACKGKGSAFEGVPGYGTVRSHPRICPLHDRWTKLSKQL